MDGTSRLPVTPRRALAQATAALMDAERVVLAGGTVDEDAYDRLVGDYCRAAQTLEATWATAALATAGSTARTRLVPTTMAASRAEPRPLFASSTLSSRSA